MRFCRCGCCDFCFCCCCRRRCCCLEHSKSSFEASCLCDRSGYNVGISACEVTGCNGRLFYSAKTFGLKMAFTVTVRWLERAKRCSWPLQQLINLAGRWCFQFMLYSCGKSISLDLTASPPLCPTLKPESQKRKEAAKWQAALQLFGELCGSQATFFVWRAWRLGMHLDAGIFEPWRF